MESIRFAADGGSPVEIGRVPWIPPDRFLSILDDQAAPGYQPYRELYRSVRRRFKGKSVIAFSSAVGLEGSGDVLINLAYMLGSTGLAVLLVDADLDSPSLHQALSLSNDEGLVDMVLHGSSFDRVTAETPGPNVRFLSAGSVAPDPDEVFQAGRFVPVARSWTEWADVVLASAPPLDRLGDESRLATFVNGIVLLVPEPGSAAAAAAELEQWPALVDKLKGFVTVTGEAAGEPLPDVAGAMDNEDSTPPTETLEPEDSGELTRGGRNSMGDEEKDLKGMGPSEEDLEAELEAELDKLSLDDEIGEEDLLGEEDLVIDGSVDLEGLDDDEPEEKLEVEEPPTFEAETVDEEVPEELELEDALPKEEPVEPLGGADLGDDAESEEISPDDLASGLEEELEVIEQEETREAEPEVEPSDTDLDDLMAEAEGLEADISLDAEDEDVSLDLKEEPLELETETEPEEREPEAEALGLEIAEDKPLELETASLELDADKDELISEVEMGDLPEEEEPETPAEGADEEEIIFPTDEQMGIAGGPEEDEAETSEAAAVTKGVEVDETDMSFLDELDGENGRVAEEKVEEGEDEDEPVFEVDDEDEEEHDKGGKRSPPLVLIAGVVVLVAGVGYLWWSGIYRDLPVVGPLLGGGESVEEFLVEEMPMPSAETTTPGSAEQALPEVSVVPVEPEAAGPVLAVDGPLFPYAVHTSSFKRLWLANREVVRLNRAGFSAFRAYTNVPGRGWFHRVYVAEAGSPSAGLNLANRMKGGRVSTFAETRNVPFGCLLGVYNDRAAAEARITELRESGYSPYIEAEAGGKLRLYVGAFESSDECGDLAAKLDSDDIPHRIVER